MVTRDLEPEPEPEIFTVASDLRKFAEYGADLTWRARRLIAEQSLRAGSEEGA